MERMHSWDALSDVIILFIVFAHQGHIGLDPESGRHSLK